MPHLKAYDKEGNVLNIGDNIETEQGSVIIPNLSPHTHYPRGEFFVSWEGDNYESEKVVVPEFTTLQSSYKEITFYAKDILTVKPKTAYDIAVDNGFTGTEKQWVESIKGEPGEKGDKLSFSDLTYEDKEELRGQQGLQGLQGVRGDAPNLLKVNSEYDVTVFQPIAPSEYNAMRYFRETSNTDEFMKGYDNYVAKYGTLENTKTIKEDYSKVISGSMRKIENNDNNYTIEIGTTIEHTFTGYSISMTSNTGTTGGMWKASIDGSFVKNISTWFNGVGTITTQLIADNLENTEHTLTLEYIGQDPDHPVENPRGWIRTGKYSSYYNTFTILKKETVNGFHKIIDVAYPISNKEYAIAVRPKDSNESSEFFPYHGKQTSFKGENYVRQLIVDGQEVDLTKKSEDIQFKEARLIQKVEHKLPTDYTIRMECTFIVTFKDSRVYNDIRFKWIKPSQVTSGYVFQMPFDANWFDSVVVDSIEQINKSLKYGTQSDFNNDNATIYTGISNDSVGKDYVYQCVINNKSVPVDRLWLQHRDERLQKLYPQYYNKTNRDSGDIDVFSGYYEILKIKDANKVYKI